MSMLSKSEQKKLERRLVKYQKEATAPNSILCKLGWHTQMYVVAQYGFIMTFTKVYVCMKCGNNWTRRPCSEAYGG